MSFARMEKSPTAAGAATFFRLTNNAGTSFFQGSLSISGSNWAISTAYTLGQRVVANGNVYVCSQAGTSAASGSGGMPSAMPSPMSSTWANSWITTL